MLMLWNNKFIFIIELSTKGISCYGLYREKCAHKDENRRMYYTWQLPLFN